MHETHTAEPRAVVKRLRRERGTLCDWEAPVRCASLTPQARRENGWDKEESARTA